MRRLIQLTHQFLPVFFFFRQDSLSPLKNRHALTSHLLRNFADFWLVGVDLACGGVEVLAELLSFGLGKEGQSLG